jgi:eukaryotic-like serine/threonine-protein kinase
MSLEGHQLDHYHIVRLLGSGGMGDVYLAEDERIGQQVALKVIRVEVSSYPAMHDVQKAAHQFRREARAIAMLDHPHILPLYSYGEQQIGDKSIVYLVMPYRPEGSLAQWMSRRGGAELLPPRQSVQIIHQAAEALQDAHDHQIIHQDVKPSNFLIRKREKTQLFPDILLADFGIAKLTTTASSTSQSIRGTPVYMAPEQWQGNPVPASDQYALGIMAYELLTGRPPFLGVPGSVMFQHLTSAPTPPSVLNSLLSEEVDNVLLQALAKEPAARFVSVTAFADALEDAIQRLDQRVAPVKSTFNPPTADLQSVSDATDNGPTLVVDNGPTLLVSKNRQSSITHNIASGEKRLSTPLPLERNALTTSPDFFSGNQRNAAVAPRFPKLRTILLLGLVLLLLLGSGGFIYASVLNQKSGNTPATATAQTNGTNFAFATTNAATATGASEAAQASATALAVNATVTARDATATAQAIAIATAMSRNATATSQANPTPTVQTNPTPTPRVSSLKILGTASNFNGYCQSIGDSSASLDGNTAYSWHCVTPGGQHTAINMDGVCELQYSDSRAISRMLNYNDANSWQCFTNAQKLGMASNLNGYCQSIGDNSALLNGNTAYSWVCVTPGGQHVGIWVDSACQWQYNISGAIARVADYFNPNSWECWG